MSIKKKIKTRLLRLWVTVRAELMHWCIALLIGFIFLVGVYRSAQWCLYMGKNAYHAYILNDLYDCYSDSYDLSDELRFYDNGPHSYIRDKKTHEKVVEDIFWVAGRATEDTLLCFAKDGYRGYLNRHTGEVVIPADHYRKAWVFSEGLAAAMGDDSMLVFIDTAGKVQVDTKTKFSSKEEGHGFLFHGGYCALTGPNDLWGLIDRQGNWAVEPQYDDLYSVGKSFWMVKEGHRRGMLDGSLRVVAEPVYKEVILRNEGIEVLKEDYTRQLLSFDGRLLHAFTYTNVKALSYKAGCENGFEEDYTWELAPCKAYYTTYEEDDSARVGLLSPDGIPLTPPVYREITAINEHCYRGYFDYAYDNEGLSVLLDNKGQVITPPE